MSLLKPIEGALGVSVPLAPAAPLAAPAPPVGQAAPAPSAPPAVDPHAAFHDARTRAEALVVAELHRMEDAFEVSLKAAEERAAGAEARLATLKMEHERLQAAMADALRKLEVLRELKVRLEGL